jgi:hypothetical protein
MLKRLIEVALPLKEVSQQSAREKPIRHGHISTLHIPPMGKPGRVMKPCGFRTLSPGLRGCSIDWYPTFPSKRHVPGC